MDSEHLANKIKSHRDAGHELFNYYDRLNNDIIAHNPSLSLIAQIIDYGVSMPGYHQVDIWYAALNIIYQNEVELNDAK